LAGFLHWALETRWQRFGQFLDDFLNDFLNELINNFFNFIYKNPNFLYDFSDFLY